MALRKRGRLDAEATISDQITTGMASVLRVQEDNADDPRPMRLHWIGPIVPKKANAGPMVRALFVPLRSGSRKASELSTWSNYAWKDARIVDREAGLLPILVPGSLWVGGVREEDPLYEEITVDVRVPHEAKQLYGPRELTPRNNHVIPRNAYPIDSRVGLSRVLLLRATGAARVLVIPCAEIFRFYYAPTTKLANSLLDGTWITRKRRVVGRKSTMNYETGEAYLEVGKYHDYVERIEIARMFFGSVGRRESENIIPQAILHGTDDHQFPLVIRPPFEGDTTLTVRGLRYTVGGVPAFLVFSIESCTHPMPWKKLWFNRNNPGSQGRSSEGVTGTAYAGTFRRTTSIESGESMKVVQGAQPGSTDVALEIDGGLDLSRYKSQLADEFAPRGPIEKSGASIYSDAALGSAKFAMGAGVPGSAFRATAITSGDDRGVPHKLSAFRAAVVLLPTLDPRVVFIHEDIFDLVKAWMPDDETVEAAWAYLDSYDRQLPRRAAIARLRLNNTPYVLFDTELRERKTRAIDSDEPSHETRALDILRSPIERPMTDGDVQRLLRAIIETRGIAGGASWERCSYASWRHATIAHKKDEPPIDYARRILDGMTGPRKRFTAK